VWRIIEKMQPPLCTVQSAKVANSFEIAFSPSFFGHLAKIVIQTNPENPQKFTMQHVHIVTQETVEL
jgi:hypothetical protein